MFPMNAASILVSTGSSLVRIFASSRCSALASRSKLASEREVITSMSSVGSEDPWMMAANPPRTTNSTPSSKSTSQISTGSNLIGYVMGREDGHSHGFRSACSPHPPCVERGPRWTSATAHESGLHRRLVRLRSGSSTRPRCEFTPLVSRPFEVGDRSSARANEIVRRNRKHVVPRSRRRPHLVVLQQVRVNKHTQLCAVTKRRHATSGFGTLIRPESQSRSTRSNHQLATAVRTAMTHRRATIGAERALETANHSRSIVRQ